MSKLRQSPKSLVVLLVMLLFGASVSITSVATASTLSKHGRTSHSVRLEKLAVVTKSTSTISLKVPAYTPIKPALGTDIYHCSILNPKNTTNEMITSTSFTAGTGQVHHAMLYLVYPAQVAAAEALDNGGKGWTCFGAPQLNGSNTISEVSSSPWLSAWAPGHGTDVEPVGTGMPLPAGSLIIMQIHYNLLVDCGPNGVNPTDHSAVTLKTVPAAHSVLKPLSIVNYVAPPNIPCPTGVTGPLCDRAASLVDLGQRFGQGEVNFVNLINAVCGNPAYGDSTSCTWPVVNTAVIRRVTPHMHLLGATFTLTLNPGTANAKVLVNVTNYNFDYQQGYDISPPVSVSPGDKIQVTCSWNPNIRALLPQTKDLPPRFITWGDGSSDEMCLAILGETAN